MNDTHDATAGGATGQRALIAAAAEGFAQALAAPLTGLTNQSAAQARELAELTQTVSRLTAAVEGILDRLTPPAERGKTVTVNGYVRSSNNGGELVWLYGAHPGLQWKVATVYSEDFGHLRPFLDPRAGKVYDGEVAPSRDAAVKKGYLNPTAEFAVVLRPTGRQTENGQPIYDFQAARALADGGADKANSAGAPPAPAAAKHMPSGVQDATPAVPAAPAAPLSSPAASADALFDALVSASVERGRAGGAGGSAALPQAVVVGPAYTAYLALENDFARRDPRYQAAEGGVDRVRVRQLVYALGQQERGAASRFARITLENLAEVAAVLTAYAAQARP